MKKNDERLHEALKAVYRGKKGPEPSAGWELSIMRSIRDMPGISDSSRWSDIIGRLFWEICPAACAVILLLAVASYRINIVPSEDFSQIVGTDDMAEMILADSNG